MFMRIMNMDRDDQNRENNDQKWIDIPSFVNSSSEVNQMSGRLKNSSYEFDDTSDFVKEVNSSLAKQVSNDLDKEGKTGNRRHKKKRLRNVMRGLLIALLALTAAGCLLYFTPAGKNLVATIATEYIYHNLDYQPDSTTASGGKVISSEPADKIVNILLLGVEEFGGAKNTDSMIIATMNTENHSLKLTSLMRDLYVDIPGYDKNRLNSAYAKGGIELLYDTIENNFGIQIDGYCKVDFNAFEQIVDLVGGVEVTLTSAEAKYLNTTNYISDRANRNVVVGTQTLNGNQALGYCRIRKRSTSTESNDFGRTQRQRIVLKSIYNKIMKKNIVDQVLLMNKILTEIPVDTDITKSEFKQYIEEAMSLKVKDLETLRIPTDGSYDNITVRLGKLDQEVLAPKDWNATRTEIYDFIYGTSSGKETQADNETATGKSQDTGDSQ